MSQGPILIFDKSTLESLNPDEAVWLDNFFITNITPLFYIETLADLEKQVRSGRTPEQIVGNLALKTPDMQSHPNVHHSRILAAELSGLETVPMDGRPMISGGKPVTLDGQTGIMFYRTPEAEAFHRWQLHEFLDVERHIAKAWRQALSSIDYDEAYHSFQTWFTKAAKPKTLQEVKWLVDERIDGFDQESSLRFGMTLLGLHPAFQAQVIARWKQSNKPTIREFTPYFRYVYSVDLFFYLSIAADLISRVRPSNKIDLAYLYYLPFCYDFTSSDNLHVRIIPFFLRDNQTFVKGPDLKSDLAKLDHHYALLPDDVKAQGLYRFADCPPEDTSFLVTRLWDKHLPEWRELRQKHQELSKDAQKALVDLMNRIEKEGRVIEHSKPPSMEETNYVQIQRSVRPKKGKWMRFPPEILNKKSEP